MGEKDVGAMIDFYEHALEQFGKIILGYDLDLMQSYVTDAPYTTVRRKNKYRSHRLRLWEAQHGKCWWCKCDCVLEGSGGDVKQFTVDHIISISVGGTNHWRNLVGSCFKCNNKRGKLWEKKYYVREFKKPSERIVWSDWMEVSFIYECEQTQFS